MTQGFRTNAATPLSDFQMATAQHAFRRLYRDRDSTRRFLVADETGLGKTHVAKEVIALAVEHLQRVDHVNRIDIVYVCSNAEIAAQNIRKLNITGSEGLGFATRLSLLITMPELLKPRTEVGGKPVTFVAFTPATSFKFGLQIGTAKERAVLYVLISDHLGLWGARATAEQRIFQGAVGSRQRFLDWYISAVDRHRFEPNIRREFLGEFDLSLTRASLNALIDEVVGRTTLTASQREKARSILRSLRRMLSRTALNALEPDLVILDEFQRFRNLLDVQVGGEAAELADDLFKQPDAHVVLLSATPYKAFTYAEEEADPGHYADFLKTLDFLAGSEMAVETVRADLDELRHAALSNEPTTEIRDRVQAQLRGWIARTERPPGTRRINTVDHVPDQFHVRAEEFAGFVSLRQVADAVRAPLSVEYWKSAPYFFNFLNGYQVGERLGAEMKIPDRRARLTPLFRGAQRIVKSEVEQFRPVDWGNARLRALAAETLDQGWWRLLWMPPSLP